MKKTDGKEIVVEALKNAGINPDRFGNYIIHNKRMYRIKLQENSFRIERKLGTSWYNCMINKTLYYSKYAENIVALIESVKALSCKE